MKKLGKKFAFKMTKQVHDVGEMEKFSVEALVADRKILENLV